MGEIAAETFWPTRCAVCGSPGGVLCARCRRALAFIDQWRACPRCGAPWGVRECTECNALSMEGTGFARPPFDGCVSAVLFDDAAAHIVRLNKDEGERRLADWMAFFIASAMPPEWLAGSCVTYIPDSAKALLRRGYDHGRELGLATARLLELPLVDALAQPRAHDQRDLGRADRFVNMAQALSVTAQPTARARLGLYESVIVVDDVFTTGATLYSAAHVLSDASDRKVWAATFARVY
ncbi:MAG: double zinc ribbon domain-containing protein [Eggerthellaceae bacterium]|nr:double zinc ribbon domain-containing protein [Eggerthellaceae bacterium]